MTVFADPRFDAPVDIDAQIALLPADAACKGLFFLDPIARARQTNPNVDVAALAGVPPRRYLPFIDYPYRDFFRVVTTAARIAYPDLPLGHGLRRMGQTAYDTLLDTTVGRVVFGVFGLDADAVLAHGAKGYKVAVNFGEVSSNKLGERHYRFVFKRFPALLETFQVGVVEGAIRHCKSVPSVRVALHDLANAEFDIAFT